MKTKKRVSFYHLLIMLLIIGIIVLQIVVRINAIKDNYHIYISIFIVLMLLLISALLIFPCRNHIHRKVFFNIPFLSTWVCMCLCMFYSDIVVFKKYWFLSLVLLILFTAVYVIFQMYSAKDRDRLWSCFIRSIEIVFIGATVFCFLFRPFTSGVRYAGLSANPNVYAMFIITVWACLISRFDYAIREEKPIKCCILIYAESGCALFFLYMTGARTSFAAIFMMSVIWFVFRLFFARKAGKTFIRYILSSIPVIAISFFVSYGLLATIPHLVNHPVVFERDKEFLAKYDAEDVCLAAAYEIEHDVESAIHNADKEPSLIKRITMIFKEGESLDTILNGRISIYNSYIRKIDMKGHRKYSKNVKGERVIHAHNNAIQMGYTYGIAAMIFYILVNIFSIVLSIRYYIRHHDDRRCAALPLMITFGFIITSITESLLMPMQSLLAFAYYLSIGELINTQKD